MKFTINGVSDSKLLLSLKKLTNAFLPSNQFVDSGADYIINFTLTESLLILRCNDMILEKTVYNKVNEQNNQKYSLLGLYYEFLHLITKKNLPWGVLTGIRPTKLAHRYLKTNPLEEVVEILKTKYLVSESKARLLANIASLQRQLIPDFDNLYQNISIYINIPFCVSRCTYCSFTAFNLNYSFVSIDQYLDKLLEEIEEVGKFVSTNKINLTSIYIGGGTPSALNEQQLKRLLDKVETSFNLTNVSEYTLECGRPDTLSESKLTLIKAYSVTRISINPQTFNQTTLYNVNRLHEVEDINKTFYLARKLNYNNINMDLIMGLPGENLNDALNSVNKTLTLNPESITVHTLAYKRGAPLNQKLENENAEVEKMFNYSYNQLIKASYQPYYLYRQKNIAANLENIGYAKPGYASIYNIVMIEELQNIIGLGCGASSKYLNKELVLNPKDLISYVNSYQAYLGKKLDLLQSNLVKIEEEIDE